MEEIAGSENSKRSNRVEDANFLSSDSEEAFLENAKNEQSESPSDNINTDNIVWKQMGTAKGAGKLHMGGKWLNNIEVKSLKDLALLDIII